MNNVLCSDFYDMSVTELMLIEGGSMKQFGYVLGGCVLIGASPFVAVTPAGVWGSVAVFGLGVSAIGKGSHNE